MIKSSTASFLCTALLLGSTCSARELSSEAPAASQSINLARTAWEARRLMEDHLRQKVPAAYAARYDLQTRTLPRVLSRDVSAVTDRIRRRFEALIEGYADGTTTDDLAHRVPDASALAGHVYGQIWEEQIRQAGNLLQGLMRERALSRPLPIREINPSRRPPSGQIIMHNWVDARRTAGWQLIPDAEFLLQSFLLDPQRNEVPLDNGSTASNGFEVPSETSDAGGGLFGLGG